jgi:flagellar hook-basal body complex protein FliE
VTIPAIGAIGPLNGTGATASLRPAASGPSEGFGAALVKSVDGLQQTQATADNLAVQAATGQLTDIQDYMIASTEATLATQLTVAVRDKAVEAFNDIMRMPI